MPLRHQPHKTAVRFKNKKSRSPKIFIIFVVLIFLAVAGFVWAKQEGFKDEEGINKEARKVENIFKPEPKKAPAIAVPATQAKIDAITNASRGTYGYYVIDLKGTEKFGKNEDFSFTAASSIKTAFAIFVYSKIEAGSLAPEKLWTYASADYEEGTGSLIANPFGTKISVFRVVQLMITKSDNAATNMVCRYLTRTAIQNYWDAKGVAGINVKLNEITPRAAGTVMAGLYNGDYLNSGNNIIIEHLKNSITPERIVAGVPSGVSVAHKIGTSGGAISDTAIVFHPEHPYVLVVYSDKAVGETEPSATIAAISKAVYEHFDSK